MEAKIKHPKVAFCIFGNRTIEKYRQQIINVEDTWGKLCNKFKLEYFFFLEDSPLSTTYVDHHYVYLPNVGGDYLSAGKKQWAGINWIHKKCEYDYIFICGTDTFVNVENLLDYISFMDPKNPFYIGGHGDTRQILSQEIYYHTGGAGVVLSKKIVEELVPLIPAIMHQWEMICFRSEQTDLISACDLALGYYAFLYNWYIVKSKDFWNCTHNGFPCHPHQPNKKTLIACHNMDRQDMLDYYREITG